jgi:hypothetical protein
MIIRLCPFCNANILDTRITEHMREVHRLRWPLEFVPSTPGKLGLDGIDLIRSAERQISKATARLETFAPEEMSILQA